MKGRNLHPFFIDVYMANLSIDTFAGGINYNLSNTVKFEFRMGINKGIGRNWALCVEFN